jgi:hypothetical protein
MIQSLGKNRKRILGVVLFLVGLFVLDRAAGFVFAKLLQNVKTGQTVGRINASLDHRDDDIIVFGNSRAMRHIDPRILTEGTSCSAYNAGVQGQNIYYYRMLESLMISRGTSARLFVLLADPGALYSTGQERARNMAPFVDDNETVRRMVREITPFAEVKLASRAYRYNGLALSILRHTFSHPKPSETGFVPLHGNKLGSFEGEGPIIVERKGPGEVQPKLVETLREYIVEAQRQGIAVVLVQGPRLSRFGDEEAGREALESLTRELSTPMIRLDETVVPEFRDPGLYRDLAHLNAEGAELFSRKLADELHARGLMPAECGGAGDGVPAALRNTALPPTSGDGDLAGNPTVSSADTGDPGIHPR